IGRDHHVDLAAELARQHRALDVASRQFADRRVGRAGLDAVARNLALGLLAKLAAFEPPATGSERWAVEIAECQIVGDAHARDAGVLERLLRQARKLVAAHLLARGPVALAADADLASRCLALAGEHLNQLALAVAGDAGDAHDLAGLDGE